jgi:hypothetical protein
LAEHQKAPITTAPITQVAILLILTQKNLLLRWLRIMTFKPPPSRVRLHGFVVEAAHHRRGPPP